MAELIHKNDGNENACRDRTLCKTYSRVCMVIFVGTVISFMFFLLMLTYSMREMEKDFRHDASLQLGSVTRKIDLFLQFSEDLRAFYAASENVTADEFAHFTASILKRGDLDFISWVPFADTGSLRQDMIYFETRDPALTEAVIRFLIEDEALHKLALQTRKSGRMTFSEPVDLPAGDDRVLHGQFLVDPIYPERKDVSADVQGYAISFVRTVPFFMNVFQLNEDMRQRRNIHVFMHDGDVTGQQKIFDHYDGEEAGGFPDFDYIPNYKHTFSVEQTIPIGSRSLSVVIEPSLSYFTAANNASALMALILGLSLTAVTAFLFYRQISLNIHIQDVVDERTKALRESNQALDDFVYIVSHDLKEPLRGIYNYAVFLQEDYGDKLEQDGIDKLETLQKLSKRMEALIDTLLQYSRLGRTELAIKPTDLKRVLEEVIEMMGPQLEAVDADVTVQDDMPTVICDYARVSEIFRNLITNGLKYNDRDQKHVEVGFTLTHETAPGTRVFFVKDNGIGIDPDHHEVVFKMFKRLHGRDDYGGGTGSGLPIVKKIIDRHQGKIWIEPAEGGGTVFYFTLEA